MQNWEIERANEERSTLGSYLLAALEPEVMTRVRRRLRWAGYRPSEIHYYLFRRNPHDGDRSRSWRVLTHCATVALRRFLDERRSDVTIDGLADSVTDRVVWQTAAWIEETRHEGGIPGWIPDAHEVGHATDAWRCEELPF